MRALNYIEIRTLVRSNSIGIDINSNVFNHPLYNRLDVSEIDYNIKQRAFNNSFMTISDYSYDSTLTPKLKELQFIKGHAITRPKKDYINTRFLNGFKLIYSKFKNFLRQTSKIRIRPYQTVSIPLMINIIEGVTLPELIFNLNDELVKKGLKVININCSLTENEETSVSVYNSSNKFINIKDLEYIGEIRLIIR